MLVTFSGSVPVSVLQRTHHCHGRACLQGCHEDSPVDAVGPLPHSLSPFQIMIG